MACFVKQIDKHILHSAITNRWGRYKKSVYEEKHELDFINKSIRKSWVHTYK